MKKYLKRTAAVTLAITMMIPSITFNTNKVVSGSNERYRALHEPMGGFRSFYQRATSWKHRSCHRPAFCRSEQHRNIHLAIFRRPYLQPQL